MTFKEQLKTLLEREDEDYPTVAESFMWEEEHDKDLFQSEGITVEYVDNYGGEDQGSDYWWVYSFTRDGETLLVRFQGWYQSFHGAEYEEYRFVEPREKMVTVYE